MRILIMMTMFLTLCSPMTYKETIKPNSSSYCVLSMNDDTILEAENQNYTQSVASISKIMTALIAIENGTLSDEIKVDDSIDQVDGSMLYLKKGEVYTLEDLLYGLMLRSGNDAAVLIAKHIGGTQKKFVKMMNEKAKKIGMTMTHFANPSGLDEDGGNISSSCDMALLMSYAMKNKTFAQISGSKTYSPEKTKLWKNKNRFLFSYPYATGGKTGFTKKARRTLVTTSKKDHLEIAVVTLRVSDDFALHETLHNQFHESYDAKKIVEKGKYRIGKHDVNISNPIYQTIKKEESVDVSLRGHYDDDHYILYVDDSNKKRKMVFSYE